MPTKGSPEVDGGFPEHEIVGDDDPVLRRGTIEHSTISAADQPLLLDGSDVATPRAQAVDRRRGNVLVAEQRETEQLHAVVFSSQTCSPLRTLAAYRNAAATPSAVS
jgi:hypothetical protein